MSVEFALSRTAAKLVKTLTARNLTVATAESCTGGWIAKMLTDVPGSSGCFGYGLVSYSNEAKAKLLGVDPDTLERHGAVSEAVVTEMAESVLKLSAADMAVAVSGIAGPDGGSTDKPVGTVWFAFSLQQPDGVRTEAEVHRFGGGRDAVRSQSVAFALEGLGSRVVRLG